ncbi:MAG: discoidin domain-containing protein [Clostridia bacterium]|nr:discoidin domain-containing protein [Clostridia bacterium]
MKLMKKALSLVVVITILASLFAFPAISANAAEEKPVQTTAYKWLYSDDFNSYTIGEMPPTSSISSYTAKTHHSGIAPVPSERDRSILMQARPSESASADFMFHTKSFKEGVRGKFIVQFDVRIDNPAGVPTKNLTVYNAVEGSTTSQTTWGLGGFTTANHVTCAGKDSGYTLPEGKFTTVSYAVDLDNKKVDLYINYKLRVSDAPLSDNAKSMDFIRVHFTGIGKSATTEGYFDNMKIYEGDVPLTPAQIAAYDWDIGEGAGKELMDVYMANKLGFFVDSSNYYIDGEVQKMDEGKVTAIEKDGETYIPVKYGAEAFGGKVAWDANTKTTSMTVNDKEVKIATASGEVTVDGEKRDGDHVVFIENGRTYVASKLFSELSGKNLWEETGIILFSDIEVDYNWYDDKQIIQELMASMCYDRPDGEQIEQDLRAKFAVGEHPRIWATADDFERIKHEVATSEIKKDWFEKIKTHTENYIMKIELPEYGTTDGIRMRVHCDRIRLVLGWTGFMWRMTGDEKYAEHAWTWMEKMGVGSYPDWNHAKHWLDTGTFMIAYANGYDWFYDWMNEDQRKLVRDTIVKFGLEEYRKSRFWGSKGYDNWNSVINAGVIMCSIAIMDEEPEICKQVIGSSIESFEGTIKGLAPDGGCLEGPSYWQLVIESCVEGCWALQMINPTAYGLINSPGFAEAGWFPFALAGKATLNYGNAGALDVATLDSKDLFWLANINDDQDLRNYRYKLMLDNNIDPDFREMIACVGDPSTEYSALSLDKYYRMVETAAIRSSWNAETMLFGGLHAGQTTIANGDLDTGNFYIDSFGDRFVCDLPIENYNLPGYNNAKYRERGEGHNLLIFNPDDRPDDILLDGYAKIERFESNEVSAIMTTDITCNYADVTESVIRGMRFVNGRTSIVLQDEVKSDRKNEVYWFMHTQALNPTISEDGKTAILDMGGNRMEVKLLSDVGKFGVMEAKQLPTSPQIAGQSSNAAYCKLYIHLEDVEDFTISVCFTPLVYTPVGGSIKYPEVTPIDTWELEDPEKVSVGVLPKLDTLKLDGKEILGFNPDRNFYIQALKLATSPIPEIEATGDGEVEVIYPDEWPGNIEIKINNGVYENVYGIRFNVPPQSLADQGYTELDIAEVTASSIPQPENPPESAFDNDFGTRFSVEQPGWICVDLGEAKPIHYLSLAFYLGDQRQNEFFIEISEDGTAWTKVWQGRDGGTTLELQNFDLAGVSARYIRVTGTGIVNPGSDAAKQGWFSPTELKVYTK